MNSISSSSSSSSDARTGNSNARAEHLVVESLPFLLDDSSVPMDSTNHRQYAGHLPADESGNRQLFYWLVAPEPPAPDGQSSDHKDKQAEAAPPPLVVWLNGGPYYSSLVGLFMEHGPFRLINQTAVQGNPHSWHRAPAWVLYVDQPVGTGLSYIRSTSSMDRDSHSADNNAHNNQKYCKDDACICADFYYFLRQFLWFHREDMLTTTTTTTSVDTQHSVLSLSRKLYFAGESYAGQYIPTIVDFILQRNKELLLTQQQQTSDDRNGSHDSTNGSSNSSNITNRTMMYIPIAGAAIGNGYMGPRMGYNNAMAEYSHGYMDLSQKAYMDAKEGECNKLLDDNNDNDDNDDSTNAAVHADDNHRPHADKGAAAAAAAAAALSCYEETFDDFNVAGDHAALEVCDYNAQLWFPASTPYPPGRRELEHYMNNERVLEAIHATNFSLNGGKFKVHAHHSLGSYHVLTSVSDKVARILDDNDNDVRLLFYNGMLDLMCDHFTNEQFLSTLDWEGRSAWVTSKRYAWNPFWKYNDKGDIVSLEKPSGFAKEHGGLSFVKILDAGHLVPMDQPEVSLAMIQTFLRGDPFIGAEQKLGQLDPMLDERHVVVPAEKQPVPHSAGDHGSTINILLLVCTAVVAICIGFVAGRRWSNTSTIARSRSSSRRRRRSSTSTSYKSLSVDDRNGDPSSDENSVCSNSCGVELSELS